MTPLQRLRVVTWSWFAAVGAAGLGIGVAGTVLVLLPALDARDMEIERLRAVARGAVSTQALGEEAQSLQSFSAPMPASVPGPAAAAAPVVVAANLVKDASPGGADGSLEAPAAAAPAQTAPVAVPAKAPDVVAVAAAPAPTPAPAPPAAPPAERTAAKPAKDPQPSAADKRREAAEKERAEKAAREREREKERARTQVATVTVQAALPAIERPKATTVAPAHASAPARGPASTDEVATPPDKAYGPTQRVTPSQAGIEQITRTEVVFKSGLRVTVGEKFPSGEALQSIDPNLGEILTDRRRIVLTKQAPAS